MATAGLLNGKNVTLNGVAYRAAAVTPSMVRDAQASSNIVKQQAGLGIYGKGYYTGAVDTNTLAGTNYSQAANVKGASSAGTATGSVSASLPAGSSIAAAPAATAATVTPSADYAIQGLNAVKDKLGNLGAVKTGLNDSIAGLRGTNSSLGVLAGQVLDDNHYNYLHRMADTLWNEGTGLIGQGKSLMNLDTAAGGLLGEYAQWVKSVDPDRYVSMAASDVQTAYGNAAGQLNRQLTRAGSDASSTKTAAMQQQMAQSLAAALAGAKTRARQQGLSDKGQALQGALEQAKSLVNSGLQAQGAGADVEAAEVTARNQGYGIAADIYGTQADIAKNIAAIQSQIAGLDLDSAKILMDSYGTVQSAVNAANELSEKIRQADLDYNAKIYSVNVGAQTSIGYGSQKWQALFGN